MVKIGPSKTVIGETTAPSVAYFSSRGPSSLSPDILKVQSSTFWFIQSVASSCMFENAIVLKYLRYSEFKPEPNLSLY